MEMPTTMEIDKKLNLIENEIDSLKAEVMKLSQGEKQGKIIKLEGALEGISVTEKDIEEAKKSLFKAGG